MKIKSRDWVNSYKTSHPCADCNTLYPAVCMDFDHVRGKKSENVASMVYRGASNLKILEEITKCDLVCSNCHRIRTQTRRPPRKVKTLFKPWGKTEKKMTRQLYAQKLFDEISDTVPTMQAYDSVALRLGISTRTVQRYLLHSIKK